VSGGGGGGGLSWYGWGGEMPAEFGVGNGVSSDRRSRLFECCCLFLEEDDIVYFEI
jgi:hypothetical protein